MGDCGAVTSCGDKYPANLLRRGYVMYRLVLGPMLAILLLLTILTSAQENTSVSDSSAQTLMDGGVMAPAETAGGMAPAETAGDQETSYGADEMDQMIQAIGDGSGGAEDAASGSGGADGSADGTKAGQVTEASKDDSSSTAGSDQPVDTAKEAKEMDKMIQTIEANGSANSGGDQSAGAAGAGSEGADQSISVGVSSGEEGGNVPAAAGAGKDSGTLNQTKSMDKMIQTLVESDENGTSETAKGNASFNNTEPAEQLIQTPANRDVAFAANTEASGQTEIQKKTESISLLIQTLADDENRTDAATAATAESTETAVTAVTVEESNSIDQVIQALENYRDDAASSNVGASSSSGDIEIVDEVSSMDKMIQALEGTDNQ